MEEVGTVSTEIVVGDLYGLLVEMADLSPRAPRYTVACAEARRPLAVACDPGFARDYLPILLRDARHPHGGEYGGASVGRLRLRELTARCDE